MNQQLILKSILTAGGILLPLSIPMLVLTGAINFLGGYRVGRLPVEEQFAGLLPALICSGAAFLAGLSIWKWPRFAALVYVVGGVVSAICVGRFMVLHRGTGFLLPTALFVLGAVVFALQAQKRGESKATKISLLALPLIFLVTLVASVTYGNLVMPARQWHSQFFYNICDASNSNSTIKEYFPHFTESHFSIDVPPNLTLGLVDLPISIHSDAGNVETTDVLLKQVEDCLRNEVESVGGEIGECTRYSYKSGRRLEGFVLLYGKSTFQGSIEVTEPQFEGWPVSAMVHEEFVPSDRHLGRGKLTPALFESLLREASVWW